VTVLRICPACGRIGCTEHKRKPWQGSDRRKRTRSGWAQQRRARWVLHHFGRICHRCGHDGATIVDHVIPLAEGGADDWTNLRPICDPCNREKVTEEAARGRARRAESGGSAA
jgi:5-methylcytosine-specific restriction protein A